MDLKNPPRIKDPGLLQLLKLELDECELTGVTHELHLHHVIFKSHGGDDIRANIICLTEEIHTLYHAGGTIRTLCGTMHVRELVARHIDENRPDISRYLFDKLGGPDPMLSWFERHGVV